MLHADMPALRLALLALVSAAGDEPHAAKVCSRLMDEAARAASCAPASALEIIAAPDITAARLGAMRVLTTLCVSCGGCERGR